MYTSNEITSVSALKTAIDRSNDKNGAVKAVVFYDGGKVTMVYVLEVANAGNSGDGSNQNATYTVKLEKNGNNIDLKITSTNGSDTAAYSYTVTATNTTSDKTYEIGNGNGNLASGSATISNIVTNSNNNLVYKVSVTIDGDTLTDQIMG